MSPFAAYLPQDRLRALAQGTPLPEQASGVALFADLVGFTPLTEALARELGARRGAEELTAALNRVYTALISVIEAHGGSVIGFSGDALTCWFPEELQSAECRLQPDQAPHQSTIDNRQSAIRVVACALAMQAAMLPLAAVTTPAGAQFVLALKVALAGGLVRRLVVGDPSIQRLDLLAGRVIDRLADAEHQARAGEVVLALDPHTPIDPQLVLGEWRTGQLGPVAVVTGVQAAATTPHPPGSATAVTERAEDDDQTSLRAVANQHKYPATLPSAIDNLQSAELRQWLLPAVAERLERGADLLLAELRPAVALMLQFAGFDYDRDSAAGARLDAFICWVQRVATRYAGNLIDITMGDKGGYLYIAFGAPQAHDDDPARALAAATELCQPPANLGLAHPPRIGIARGQMRAGAYGGPTRRSYGVLGDKTNLAARLMAAAPTGAIYCDSATAQAAPAWPLAAQPPMQLKGKAGLTTVFRVVAHTEASEGLRPALPPLVGRDAELAQLQRALAVVQAGTSQLLILEGEAGLGKSRLIAELDQLGQAEGFTSLAGSGRSIEQQTPYRAWRELLTSFFGLDMQASTAERHAQVLAYLAAHTPEQLLRAPLLNDLLGLELPENELTAALDAKLRSESLAGLLVALLLAFPGPLLLLLEDAHWFDSRSWDVTLRLVRALKGGAAPNARLLVVLSLRPLETGHPSLPTLAALLAVPASRRLHLAQLPPGAAAALAAAQLGVAPAALPTTVAQFVEQRAGGNPLFASELVRMLLDQGLLRVLEATPTKPRQCIADAALSQAAQLLPDTLQGLLLARIDQLPPAEQLTLKVAAVIGPVFGYAPLEHMRLRQAALEPASLKHQLRRFAAHDFTWLEAPEPQLAYRFKHVLAHEAAYQTLLYSQRRDLHRIVAEWYEAELPTSTPNEPPRAGHFPLLAHHYHYAEDHERERHYAWLAGIQAAEQYANAEAAAFVSRALALTPASDTHKRFELLSAREALYELQSLRSEQQHDLDELARLALALGDAQRQARVALRQARYHESSGNFAAGRDEARRAVELARTAGDTAAEAEGLMRWGWMLVRGEDLRAGEVLLEAALQVAQAHGVTTTEIETLRHLGNVNEQLNKYPLTQSYYQRSLDMSLKVGDRTREALALINLGNMALNLIDYQAAHSYYQRALQIFLITDDRQHQIMAYGNLAVSDQLQGNLSQALASFGKVLITVRETGRRWVEGITLLNIGDVYRDLGMYHQSRAALETAVAIERELGEIEGSPQTRASLGLTLLLLGALDEAAAVCQLAHRLAMAEDNQYTQRLVLVISGHVRAAQAQPAAATALYQQAINLADATVGAEFYWSAWAGLADLARARGDLAAARAALQPLLDQLSSGFAGSPEPLRLYLSCYYTLHASNDPYASVVLDAARHFLQDRASRIHDPAQRQAFYQIATHTEVLALG